jgi:DNA repair photolyase
MLIPVDQPSLFPGSELTTRRLPVVGEQKDIAYYGSPAKVILNGPETTGMDFWSINPYVGCAFGCAYCYARYAHRYAAERIVAAEKADGGLREDLEAMPFWLAFEKRILVKQNAAAALRAQLASIRRIPERWRLLREQGIGIGSATDPYQPAERRFRLTRGILEVLAERPEIPMSIVTKSPLVTRDVDLLRRIAEHVPVSVHISLITTNRELARRLEPRSPTPESRLRAIPRLRAAGLDAGIFVMPVLPGITDEPAALDALIRAAAEAGVSHLAAGALQLRGTARRRYLPFIEKEFPELAARYRKSYAGGHTANPKYRAGLREHVGKLCAKYGVPFGYSAPDRRERKISRWVAHEVEREQRIQLGLEL